MPRLTTVRDLPFELLERILDLAAGECDLDDRAGLSSRTSFLRGAALVAHCFCAPAQSCLWRKVRVHSSDTAKKWLGSKCHRAYPATELSLEGVHAGSDGLSGATASRVLRQVVGVRTLKLMDFGRLSLRVLQNDNLSTLETLYLMSSFPDKSATVTTLAFPFHLRTLHLFNRNYSSDLLPTLFGQCASTLTSLTLITSPSSPSYASLVRAFPAVAPSLVHLSLQHRPAPALVAEFATCTRLERLECSFAVDLAAVLDALPTPSRLAHLSVELDYNLVDVAHTLVARLDRDDALGRLDRLTFPRAPARTEFRQFGGDDLLARCRDRGITLELGEVVAWRTRSVFE
ncbi:hypothetical protein JCM11491_005096 [Sporobolomyces phaffii]